ncbi:MAG: Hsp20/alpha crystallin family protein [Verrucomicrobia bacterium]|nr:MAG: Hsp20/alpha crystallin family protein [Verrucomicrobiota bacterium]
MGLVKWSRRMTTNLLAQWSALHRKQCGLSGAMLAPHEVGCWTPPTDVVESARGLLVRMEVAGVARAELCVRLEGRVLIVEGTRPSPCRAGLRFRQMELEYGPFRRVVPLPFAVASRRAVAELADGVLEIFLPRATRPSAALTVTVVVCR